MGLFSGLNQAKVGNSGVYFLPGTYVVECQKIHIVNTRAGGNLFVFESKILESSREERPVGSSCSWAVKMELDAAEGNIKELLAALSGKNPRDEAALQGEDWEAIGELAVSDEQPFEGERVHVSAVEKDKKTKPGETFTLCRFEPASE